MAINQLPICGSRHVFCRGSLGLAGHLGSVILPEQFWRIRRFCESACANRELRKYENDSRSLFAISNCKVALSHARSRLSIAQEALHLPARFAGSISWHVSELRGSNSSCVLRFLAHESNDSFLGRQPCGLRQFVMGSEITRRMVEDMRRRPSTRQVSSTAPTMVMYCSDDRIICVQSSERNVNPAWLFCPRTRWNALSEAAPSSNHADLGFCLPASQELWRNVDRSREKIFTVLGLVDAREY